MTDARADTPTRAHRWLRLRWLRTLASRVFIALVALLIGALGMRAWMSRSAPDLQPWHLLVPEELSLQALKEGSWAGYVEAEDRLFASVTDDLNEALEPEHRSRFNRYNPDSVVHPQRFTVDWNRSFVLDPPGAIKGVAVLLHGLTDSPYSMRHLAGLYRDRGFVALGLRTPAHGTVPGALTRTSWEDWVAATHLAVREARRRAGDAGPIHLIGYSNGGALALKYALDAIEDPALVRPDRIVLLSPMIGVTRNARFAGIAGWPSALPAFAKSAWLDNLPEFNPFKYNSFPVNAARQSYLLTDSLQTQVVRLSKEKRLNQLPPVLTFQSMVDATVRTDAVVNAFYMHLPTNGSELVLFDINRDVEVSDLMRPGALLEPAKLLVAAPYNFRLVVVTNESSSSRAVVARVTEAGARGEIIQPLNLSYPAEVFSLSHIALPFPVTDGLYGLAPDPAEDFGIPLGALGMRGERGVLFNGVDIATVRISSNPFFAYIVERIEAGIPSPAAAGEG